MPDRVNLEGPRQTAGAHSVQSFFWPPSINGQGAGRIHDEMKGSADRRGRDRRANRVFILEDEWCWAGAMQRFDLGTARILSQGLNESVADRSA